MKSRLLLIIVSLALAACEEKPYQPPVPHTEKPKPEPGLFQDQRNALDKAKTVEPQLEEQAQRQREAIEQQEGK